MFLSLGPLKDKVIVLMIQTESPALMNRREAFTRSPLAGAKIC